MTSLVPSSGSNAMSEARIKVLVAHAAPLEGITETDGEWIIGSMHVGKREPVGGTSWRGRFDETTGFRAEWFDFPDVSRRGWAIVFRHTAHASENAEPIEYIAGWVPPEREGEARDWVGFLNREIKSRLREASSAGRAGQDVRFVREVCFREFGHGGEAPSLADARGQRAAAHKEQVVAYLRAGKVLSWSPGLARDVSSAMQSPGRIRP
jgi:hypothetical protein